MSASGAPPIGAGAVGAERTGEELLAEFLMERLRKQYDWNVGLNGRASMLLALAGLALTLLLDSEFQVGDGSTLQVIAKVGGFALLVSSAIVLLLALRNRPEAVWRRTGLDDFLSLDDFVASQRGASYEEVSVGLVTRLLDGTRRNEKVLSSKSKEIGWGIALALIGLVSVALGSIRI